MLTLPRLLPFVALLGALACQRGAPPGASSPAAAPAAGAAAAPGPVALSVAVDPRVELVTLLFRIAGSPEYQRAYDTPYRRAADAHFARFAAHPAVAATAALRAQHGISHDAPVQLAVQLDRETFAPARPLDPPPPGLDERWHAVDRAAYAVLVQDFARASGFWEFWDAQHATRAAVEERYRHALADRPIIAWFDEVFGARDAAYHVAPGLLTGPMAYGVRAVRPDGREDIVQVLYLEAVDAAGLPQPGERTVEFLVHELAHSYVNPVCERSAALAAAAQPLFDRTAAAMQRQQYPTPRILVNESVVRALVVLFLRERATPAQAARSLSEQESLSFLWTADLVAALDALRERHGGRLPPAGLVETTRATFERWAAGH
jgi:hypothetical protein